MALPAFTPLKSAISFGKIAKIELRQYGTGSFLDIGAFDSARISVTPLTQETDPVGTSQVWALEYAFSFDALQTSKTVELAGFLAGTSGTGLLETDAEVKFTFSSGRTITLGAATGSAVRIISAYDSNGDGAQIIRCSGTTVEAISTLGAKVV